MPLTQIPGRLILDGTVTEDDIALSDVTALNADSNRHGFLPKLPNDAGLVLNGAGSWVFVPNKIATSTNLNLNLNTATIFICSLSTNSTFNISNIITGVVYYFLLKSTNGAITITMPSSNDIKSKSSFTISATNKVVEVSVFSDGSFKYWQISEELG